MPKTEVSYSPYNFSKQLLWHIPYPVTLVASTKGYLFLGAVLASDGIRFESLVGSGYRSSS